MLIWLALGIPFAVAVALWKFYSHKMVFWEYLLPLLASSCLIFAVKHAVEVGQTRDTEIWGTLAQDASYQEAWDEEVPCSHTKYCTRTVSKSDGKGGTTTETESYDCGTEHNYDVENHPPQWHIVAQDGEHLGIGQARFETLAVRWKVRKFVEMNRDYHSIDGNKYETYWDKRRETFEPIVTEHSYENRVQASNSIFRFPDVSPKDAAAYNLFPFPRVSNDYTCPAVMGYSAKNAAEVEREMQYLNATLGPAKQVRLMILVFTGQPYQAGQMQENLWQGGNKNEFILCIGTDKQRRVQWVYPISWTEVDTLKVEAKSYVMHTQRNKELNLLQVTAWLGEKVPLSWKRREFKEFSYLTVEPPPLAVALTYLFTLLVSLGCAWWAIHNNFGSSSARPPRPESVRRSKQ